MPDQLTILLCISLAFGVLWVASRLLKRVCIIDAAWGPGFVLASACAVAINERSPGWPQWLLTGMVFTWGMRLGLHLILRVLKHREEDRRYAAMAARHGVDWWWRSLFIVFLLQAVILWLVALPLTFALLSPSGAASAGLLVPGMALWAVGFIFEAGGDWQLRQFLSDPGNRGKVLQAGFWGWTRHPNYFGDFLVWWGHFLVAFAIGAPWWTGIGPLVMSIFLMKFSGVGLLEKDIANRRPGYAEYVRRTPAFFPWPPARNAASDVVPAK